MTCPQWRRQVFGLPLGFALAWTLVAPARAEQSEQNLSTGNGRFVLEITACPTVSTEEVRHILGIEIGDLLLGATQGEPGTVDRLSIRCTGNFAWIEAKGPTDSAPLEKLLRLDDFPGDATARALALAGLELLAERSSAVRERMVGPRSSTPPPTTPPPTTPPPTTPAPTTPAPTTPAPTTPAAGKPQWAAAKRETRVGLATSWRRFLAQNGPSLWGGQVQVSTALGERCQIGADADVAGARNKVADLGETSALLLSTGASFGFRTAASNLAAAFGFGGRIGVVRLAGSSADPANVSAATVWHPWGGPMVAASLRGGFGRFALTLGAEAGQSLLQPEGRAGGATVISLRGPWAALSLGASIRL